MITAPVHYHSEFHLFVLLFSLSKITIFEENAGKVFEVFRAFTTSNPCIRRHRGTTFSKGIRHILILALNKTLGNK